MNWSHILISSEIIWSLSYLRRYKLAFVSLVCDWCSEIWPKNSLLPRFKVLPIFSGWKQLKYTRKKDQMKDKLFSSLRSCHMLYRVILNTFQLIFLLSSICSQLVKLEYILSLLWEIQIICAVHSQALKTN